jgi:DNA helicase II / ATP-dependent DNA helicase PcrA
VSAEHRVYGPPGTGKTYFLVEQGKRAAAKHGGDRVAIASLTKSAAEEIGSRAGGIPRRNVGTLHAFAFRALDRPELAETPEGILAWNKHVTDHAPALRVSNSAAVDPENAPMEGPARATEGDQLLAELGARRARLEPVEEWPQKLQSFNEAWEEFKQATGRLDFTDLIQKATAEIDTAPGDPRVFMLDEAQDLSRIEMALARKWGAATEHFVIVGDPDQNLYEWRGSEPGAFTATDAATERVLEQSYRVPQAVHAYAVDWIEKLVDRPPVSYRPTSEAGEIRKLSGGFGYRSGKAISRALTEATANGETAMLIATCGYMLAPVAAELKRAGVPFHNPYRPAHGGWNPLRGAGKLLAYLRPDAEVWGDEHREWRWEDVRQWMEPLQAKGNLTRGAKTFVESKTTSTSLIEDDSERNDAADFRVVRDLLEPQHHGPLTAVDVGWWRGSLRASKSRQFEYPLKIYDEHGGAALREQPRIILGTIHSVKGGEADHVFVAPDLSRTALVDGWQTKGSNRAAIIRQFYVAFTRARKSLTLLEPASGFYAQLPRPN